MRSAQYADLPHGVQQQFSTNPIGVEGTTRFNRPYLQLIAGSPTSYNVTRLCERFTLPNRFGTIAAVARGTAP